jgi:hypothetical protein
MFIDIDEIDEVDYLTLMYVLNETRSVGFGMRVEVLIQELQHVLNDQEIDRAMSHLVSGRLLNLFYQGETRKEFDRKRGDDLVGLEFGGMAVLLNYPNRFLTKIAQRFGDLPEKLATTLVPYLNLQRVPAADRYVNTTDNLPDFNLLVENLEFLKHEIVKDQNQNELPIPQKRAVIAELEGLIAQIKGGYVKISDLTSRARPLLKTVAEVCKDITVIAVAAGSALAAIKSILETLF